jgi:hypothetical protein
MQFPSLVLLNVRLSPKNAADYTALNIKLVDRSVQDDAAIRAQHVAEAAENGVDAMRGKRIDATGVASPDSGTPVFGWNPTGDPVTLAKIWDDLVKAGVVITDIHLMRKPNDRMLFLRITFSQADRGIEIGHDLAAALTRTLGSVYEHVHAFRNPNGSMTVNPSHRINNAESGFRTLRIDAEGALRREQ